MFDTGSEIRLDRQRTDNLHVKPNALQSFTTKVLEGIVVGFSQPDGVHWALKVRPYLPIDYNNGVVEFDSDGNRGTELEGGQLDNVFITVSVVNAVDNERIRALYLIGDKIQYFNATFPTTAMSDINGQIKSSWITVCANEEFWAIIGPNGQGWNFIGGYLDPTVITGDYQYFTSISALQGAVKILPNCASLAPFNMYKVKPIWNSSTKAWEYVCYGATGTFPCKITAVSGTFPQWNYEGQQVISISSTGGHISYGQTISVVRLLMFNRMETYSASYPYTYGNGVTITASDGTVNSGSCKIVSIGVGSVVDVTGLQLLDDAGNPTQNVLYSFAQANSCQ